MDRARIGTELLEHFDKLQLEVLAVHAEIHQLLFSIIAQRLTEDAVRDAGVHQVAATEHDREVRMAPGRTDHELLAVLDLQLDPVRRTLAGL